jgi:hypothetical protein
MTCEVLFEKLKVPAICSVDQVRFSGRPTSPFFVLAKIAHSIHRWSVIIAAAFSTCAFSTCGFIAVSVACMPRIVERYWCEPWMATSPTFESLGWTLVLRLQSWSLMVFAVRSFNSLYPNFLRLNR